MHLKQIAERIKQMRADKSNRQNKLITEGVSLTDEESDDRAFTRVETIVERQLSEMSEGDDDAPEHWPMMNAWCTAYRLDNPRSSLERGSQECWTEPHRSRVSPLEGKLLGKCIKRNNEIDWDDEWRKMGKTPPTHNLLIGNVVLGKDCKVDELAAWCDRASEDIVVFSMLDTATIAGHLMQTFVELCTAKSLRE